MYSQSENREFYFEAVLDMDFGDWFAAISNNIEVFYRTHCES